MFLGCVPISRRRALTSTRLPPRPPGLPLLGNLHQLGSLPHRSVNSLSKRYGPIMLLQLGVVAPTVIVSSAEIAEQVLKTQDLIFASRQPSSMANHLFYNCTDIAFSPYTDYWRKIKKICIVHLLCSKRVQSYKLVREEEVALLLADIRALSAAAKVVNLSKSFNTITNDIICRVALGRKYSKEREFKEILSEFGKLLVGFHITDYFPWLSWIDKLVGLDARARRISKKLDEFIEGVIEEHLSRKSSNYISTDKEYVDFVDVLLSIKDEDDANDAIIPLSKDNIKAIILDMFVAGTETSTTVLEWAMAELINHPTSMQKVQREIRDTVGSKEIIEEEDIARLIYLKATIKETLRLHVPAGLSVPRVAIENTQLEGFDVPIGTRILINTWAIARDPNYWDRPEEFLPERFINNNVDFKGQHFQLTPFGAGRRACPGLGFAIAIIEFTLANLLHNFDWVVPEEMKDGVVDMTEVQGLTVHKRSTLLLKAKMHYAKLA